MRCPTLGLDLGPEPNQQVMMRGTNMIERPFSFAFLGITRLIRRELPRRSRMVNADLFREVMPILPVDALANGSC